MVSPTIDISDQDGGIVGRIEQYRQRLESLEFAGAAIEANPARLDGVEEQVICLPTLRWSTSGDCRGESGN